MIKQIYASLEISEREVRILVGEYYNTRFNILKLSKAPIEGVKNFKLNEPEKVRQAIRSCLEDIKTKLGSNLEKVILVVPPNNFKRHSLRVNVYPEDGTLKKSDIQRAITHTLKEYVEQDVMVINRVPIKYSINGISYPRIPLNETCNEVVVDIDLLCADKEMTYAYAQMVEDCGLEIIDVCLSNYGASKEGVLIEQSLSKNVVLLNINHSYTTVSLLSKGKLVNSQIVHNGLDSIVSMLHTEYPLPYNTLLRLIKYNGGQESKDDIIFAYNKDEVEFSITKGQLNETISLPVNRYIDELIELCKPIIENGETMFVLEGEGADMVMLADKLKEKSNCEIKIYHSDALGVRDSELIGLFGSFFAYKEVADIREEDVNCIDLLEFEKVIDQKKLDTEGQTLTTKIKAIFEQYVGKEK